MGRTKAKSWTAEEDAIMHDRYPDEPAVDIAEALGRSIQSVYSRARTLQIKKSEDFMASPASGRLDGVRGEETRFTRGRPGWNKGMKGVTFGGKETQFKIGSTPHNHVEVGTVVMATIGYLKVKVAEPNQWEWVHRKTWIEANGDIPKGKTVIFKDGNRENCALENLELIDRSELMRRNTIHRYPKPLRLAMRTHGRLKRMLENNNEDID